MEPRKLVHEVWEEFDSEGNSLTGVCHAGRLGKDFRSMLGPGARLLTTFEAGSHYEAMTIYYPLMGWGEYSTDQAWDHQPYPDEWYEDDRESER
jgi:hypothetical protein